MAERKATNKYYPPDWDPSKGSINTYRKSHPLRDRARKVGEGVLVVRFELPFNVWCSGCDSLLAMGVRFNAEKSRVGNYYSTPIYKFAMKCRSCANHLEIQTDPANLDYTIIEGARRQVRRTDDEERSAIDDVKDADRRMMDSMLRLERKVEDKIQGEANMPSLQELKLWRSRWEDSFSANQLLRSQFRQRRKQIEESKDRDKRLLKRTSLKIPLLKLRSDDRLLSKELLKKSKLVKSEDIEVSKKELLKLPILPVRGKITPRALKIERPEACAK